MSQKSSGVKFFLSKLLCPPIPKDFVGERFCLSQNFWYRKVLRIKWGGTEVLSRLFIKTFCSTAPKNFVLESFSLLLISGIKIIMPMRVMSCFSVELL